MWTPSPHGIPVPGRARRTRAAHAGEFYERFCPRRTSLSVRPGLDEIRACAGMMGGAEGRTRTPGMVPGNDSGVLEEEE